ncbi:MAG: phospho-N-acetylmuramoyl-pentapeptide-transferase [Clostridia bacterium]|nr:phospho-N-acetylmuramoyl-pentapeptide-transferase [Clostridia bacterium]
MKEQWILFGIAAGVCFLLTALLGRLIIPKLREKKVGQVIYNLGPAWHQSKAGTPTMGGVCFILAILLCLLGFGVYYLIRSEQSKLIPLALTLSLAVMNGMIGFVDDYCKLMKKQNQGLKAYQKAALQVIAALAYILLMQAFGNLDTLLHIPFTDRYVDLGILYYVFAMFIIVGVVNSVNLTDGIDGLASTVTLVVFCFFGFVGISYLHDSLTLLSGALVGGMIGFLIYNLHPAKVFMGDTGSLFLGGVVTGAVFVINEPMIVFIVGFVYIMESVSVILQVGSFKLRNKRIFKMAPIHHHFEKCGWSEAKVVLVFSTVTALLCALAWFAL